MKSISSESWLALTEEATISVVTDGIDMTRTSETLIDVCMVNNNYSIIIIVAIKLKLLFIYSVALTQLAIFMIHDHTKINFSLTAVERKFIEIILSLNGDV